MIREVLSRKAYYRQLLIDLYSEGEDFDYGALVYRNPEASAALGEAYDELSKTYGDDFKVSSLAFDGGLSSFVDCLIGKRTDFEHLDFKIEPYDHKCLYVLFCDYTSIYVMGECAYSKSGCIYPSISSVDCFTDSKVACLAEEVNFILQKTPCQRALAKDLREPLPRQIKLESNLIEREPLVFDGYFNWKD